MRTVDRPHHDELELTTGELFQLTVLSILAVAFAIALVWILGHGLEFAGVELR